MATDRLSFASVEIDKNYLLTLPGGEVCVIGGHVASRNQGLLPTTKGVSGESLGARLTSNVNQHGYGVYAKHKKVAHEAIAECVTDVRTTF